MSSFSLSMFETLVGRSGKKLICFPFDYKSRSLLWPICLQNTNEDLLDIEQYKEKCQNWCWYYGEETTYLCNHKWCTTTRQMLPNIEIAFQKGLDIINDKKNTKRKNNSAYEKAKKMCLHEYIENYIDIINYPFSVEGLNLRLDEDCYDGTKHLILLATTNTTSITINKGETVIPLQNVNSNGNWSFILNVNEFMTNKGIYTATISNEGVTITSTNTFNIDLSCVIGTIELENEIIEQVHEINNFFSCWININNVVGHNYKDHFDVLYWLCLHKIKIFHDANHYENLYCSFFEKNLQSDFNLFNYIKTIVNRCKYFTTKYVVEQLENTPSILTNIVTSSFACMKNGNYATQQTNKQNCKILCTPSIFELSIMIHFFRLLLDENIFIETSESFYLNSIEETELMLKHYSLDSHKIFQQYAHNQLFILSFNVYKNTITKILSKINEIIFTKNLGEYIHLLSATKTWN